MRRLPPRLPTFLVSLSLAVLLIVLFAKTQVSNLDLNDTILTTIRNLHQRHAIVNTDILQTRFSDQGNYDRLNQNWQTFELDFSDLETLLDAIGTGELDITNSRRALAQTINVRWQQLEDFKSDDAVLRNSERYFATSVQQLFEQIPQTPELEDFAAQLQQLNQTLLASQFNPDPTQGQELATILNTLQANSVPENLRPLRDSMVFHGRKVNRLANEIETHIQALLEEDVPQQLDQLATVYQNYHRDLLRRTNRYRIALFSLLIPALLYGSNRYREQQKARQLRQINARLEREVAQRTHDLQDALDELKQSQSQLVQAEKMSSLGQLVAGVAHEINNPMGFIHGNLSIADQYIYELLELVQKYELAYPHPPKEVQAYAQEIDLDFLQEDLPKLLKSMAVGTDRIREIVQSLRNFSRVDSSEKKWVDVHQDLDTTLMLLRHRLKAHEHRSEIIVLKDYGDCPEIQCYPGLLNQVFMNILSNAIDALEEKAGQIDSVFKPQICIKTCRLSGDLIEISIADNGPGIKPEAQANVFNPFFTTKEIGKGTGLGLSISYQIIVERHRGQICCQSEPNQGTAFRLELPLQPDEVGLVEAALDKVR